MNMNLAAASILFATCCHPSVAFSVSPAFSAELSSHRSQSRLNIAVDPPHESQGHGTSLIYSEQQTQDLPWTTFQEWALRDNLSKYIISIPRKGSDEPELYALWRTMEREVTELSGYPIDMLQQMHTRQLNKDETGTDLYIRKTPATLPLLDDYKFESFGGLSGKAYGIVGLLDGTRVETSQVKDVQVTLPKGYIQTLDGSVAYELGMPHTDSGKYSLGIGSWNNQMPSLSSDTDFLVKIGTSTGILLAGATAMNMLSHHLTVNVFWV